MTKATNNCSGFECNVLIKAALDVFDALFAFLFFFSFFINQNYAHAHRGGCGNPVSNREKPGSREDNVLLQLLTSHLHI